GTAEKLRKEAQELLAQYQKKQRDAETEAAQIVTFAQRQMDEIRQNAETEFAEVAARREAQLSERLQRIEDKALSDIQNHAADMAVETARRIIDQTLDDKTAASLTKTAIGDVAKALN